MNVSYSDIVVLTLLLIFTIVGLAKGIFKKMMRLIVTGVSIVCAYYIASPISALFVGTSMHNKLVETMGVKGAGWLLIAITGVVAFIIIFILLKILVNLINKGIESGKILKFANRLIGGAFGLLTGLLFATVYLLVLYGLAQAIPSVNEFFMKDLGIMPEHFTISKYLLDGIMKLFNSFKTTGFIA